MNLLTSPSVIDIRRSPVGRPERGTEEPRFLLACVTEGPFAQGARECEAEVFTEVYDNTGEELAQEYAPYDAQCFLVVADRHQAASDPVGSVLAMSRIVLPGPAGHKSVDDLALQPWAADVPAVMGTIGLDVGRAMDVATLAVRRRGGRDGATAAAALCHGMSMVSIAHDLPWLVAILNRTVLRMFATWKVPLLEIPGLGPRPYYGSPASTPVYLNWHRTRAALRREQPFAHRRFVLGDLPDVVVDALPGFAASTAARPVLLSA
jgi:hypothetical protein